MRRRLFMQLLCIAFGIIFTQSSQLSPRKKTSAQSYDPYIICDLLGPSHSEGLPLEYSQEVYSELISLCSTAHGARENVGCFCAAPNSRVHCSQQLAEPDLWGARYSPDDEAVVHQFEVSGFPLGEMTFPEFCAHGCKCETEENAELWFEQTLGGDNFDIFVGAAGLTQPMEPARTGTHDGSTFGHATLIGNGRESSHSEWQNQCGNNCTSAKDCTVPAGGNSSCMCQAHSSQYQPGSGTVAFIAACLVTLGSGGKRQEGLLCPCNSTYVSQGCCDASDGLVWEPPDSNLGVVLMSP